MKDTRSLLDRATDALGTDVPSADALTTSMQRTARRLGIDGASEAVHTIQNCEGIRRLLKAYRAGTLPEPRRLLVESHLHECDPRLRLLPEDSRPQWSTGPPSPLRTRTAFSARQGLGSGILQHGCLHRRFLYRAYWQVSPGVRAEVQSVDGAAYLISDSVDRPIAPGTALHEGEQLRTAADCAPLCALLMAPWCRSTSAAPSAWARGRDMTVALDRGAVIVEAAHRTSGHLYVYAGLPRRCHWHNLFRRCGLERIARRRPARFGAGVPRRPPPGPASRRTIRNQRQPRATAATGAVCVEC